METKRIEMIDSSSRLRNRTIIGSPRKKVLELLSGPLVHPGGDSEQPRKLIIS